MANQRQNKVNSAVVTEMASILKMIYTPRILCYNKVTEDVR